MSDGKIYPDDTVDVTENEQNTVEENIRESKSNCKIYPADTVDVYGNVWPTVGENIRNGIFGENVKVGYVNINKGNVTSTSFIITDISVTNFRIQNINCFLAFPEKILAASLNISFNNLGTYCVIYPGSSLADTVATIKIIYKDAPYYDYKS